MRPLCTLMHKTIRTCLKVQTLCLPSQVTIVEKADSSSVLPSPVSVSTKSKMTFLFANLKDRDFLVQRISDFLQKTPSKQPSVSGVGRKASTMGPAPEVREPCGGSG